MLAAFIGAGAQVKPVNGRNPLVLSAERIHLPLPFEQPDDDEYDDEDAWEELDEMEGAEMLREPQSEDERVAGVNQRPPDPDRQRQKRRRMPPMPKVPRPKHKPAEWVPPFEVLPDGTVTGPKCSRDGDPPGTELPPGFDPPKGSMEGVTMMFAPPGSR